MILSFKQVFVPAVVAGTKPHTIRAGRRWRVGMSIQFYQDSRQKTMVKFRPDAVATVVQEVAIQRTRLANGKWAPRDELAVFVDNRQLTPLECQELARRDGFDDFAQLLEFFANSHGFPFTGQLIGWTDLRY
ncbi:hypothetical protein [Hymenobacter baengnokdamensis]|uniref:hypothetical protein n=1 Tax=Hymenobacter baengnokdamensis TaxID=2615203 RepID=UPI00124653EB|nr:hypothetical protein [Hymenobacter baengnokdamensis]